MRRLASRHDIRRNGAPGFRRRTCRQSKRRLCIPAAPIEERTSRRKRDDARSELARLDRPTRPDSPIEKDELPGVRFRPTWLRPTFQKFAGRIAAGSTSVIDRNAFRTVRTGLAVLAAMRELSGTRFAWRTEEYEFVADRPAIDLLFGSDRERLALEAGKPWQEIAAAWEPEEAAFRIRREKFLLYK